ncbi:MAG: CBS domain-containing protein [Dysgonamonadaceae bacterium]|jgi:predicted transcriptional regulator|nr:CBS domain-containing protein [Dysgonamonadaceae bacterium]
MFTKEILIKDIPVLKPEDSGLRALSLMEDLKLKHLPIVREGHYICLLSEKDVFAMANQESSLGNSCLYAPYIRDESSVLDALNMMSKDFLSLLPVLTETGEYVGAVTLPSLIQGLSELCNVGSEGALIAVETNRRDYILSQIIHLMESNNAGILSFFTYSVAETDKQILLFKIDLEDASPVLRSLERFNYKVIYHLQKQMLTDDVMKKRLDELMFYLEM